MIKNNLKIGIRALKVRRGFTAINIIGLAISMASAMLIMIWVNSELSYDRFYSNSKNIYSVGNTDKWGTDSAVWFLTPKPMAEALKTEYPEIKKVTRVIPQSGFMLSNGERKISSELGSFVDSAFLEIFDFKVLAGNPNTSLRDPSQIIITKSLADRLFGTENAVGSTLRIDTSHVFTVGAVLDDIPENSFMKGTTYLLPWRYLENLGMSDNYWTNNSVQTYIEMFPETNMLQFWTSLRGFMKRHTETTIENILQPITEKWLYSVFDQRGKATTSRIGMVRAFIAIACFVLLIACINFMNLSTAQSVERAREVGVRKAVGAKKGTLVFQFLTESYLIAILAGIFALLLVGFSLPYFSDLVSRRLVLNLGDFRFWGTFLGFILMTGTLAGSYPAFYLSSFMPVKVLKGKHIHIPGKLNARKVLVISQFSIAVVLIIATLFLQKQINHAQDRKLGYEKNRLIHIKDQGTISRNHNLIKSDLIEQGIASHVSRTSHSLTDITSFNGLYWKGKPENDNTMFNRMGVEDDLVATAGLELISGRDFDLKKFPTDSSAALINESALKIFGFSDPIGQSFGDNGRDWHIIGVVKDFIHSSPFDPIGPLVIKGAFSGTRTTNIKLNNTIGTKDALQKMEIVYRKFNPGFPFDYKFVDETYAAKFKETQQISRLSGLFTLLTIFISFLGLFGLAAFMAESRTKEIGIRKVLGASVMSISGLLSKDFIAMILVSCSIGFPIAYVVSDKILSSYAYRIDLTWDVFLLSGVAAILITLLTISFQSIKAALANPVDSLRDE